MNDCKFSGRLSQDVKNYGKVAICSMAVERKLKDADGKKVTDFINLKWLGEKKAQFAEKYLAKGMKLIVSGELNIDNYKNKDGQDVRNAVIIVDSTEFCESKSSAQTNNTAPADAGEFISIPNGVGEDLPFN